MTLDEQLRFVQSEAWQTRVGLVAARVALVVQAESAGTTHHTLRAALATSVLQDKAGEWDYPFTKAVIARTNPALPAVPTDAQLVTAVTSVWDAMSGAPGPA